MKKYTNINYHRLTPLIKNFVNQAVTITAENIVITDFDKWFESRGTAGSVNVQIQRKAVIHKGRTMCAIDIEDTESDVFEIHYNLASLSGIGQKQFRQDIVKRCPLAQGFADITLAMLHEIGHHINGDNEYEDYDREEEIEFINTLPPMLRNPFYFLLPDELVATDWAIEWLQDPNNRKIAKQFEKKFFNYLKNP